MSVFSHDLDVQVRHALGGVDGQRHEEIPSRRLVRTERRPFISIEDSAATPYRRLTAGPCQSEAAASSSEKPLDGRRIG